jgi:hypothetical protein
VAQVLDFRKLDANMFALSTKPIAVTRLIQEACQHCRAFMLPTVDLRYRVVPEGSWAMLDSRRVHQIVTNGLRCVERVGMCGCVGVWVCGCAFGTGDGWGWY